MVALINSKFLIQADNKDKKDGCNQLIKIFLYIKPTCLSKPNGFVDKTIMYDFHFMMNEQN